jgi:hypothetical protein
MYFGQSLLSLYGDGDALLTGSLNQNSDIRLKKDITCMSNVTSLLSDVHGYHYQWKDTSRSQDLQIGFLAQEIASSFPQLSGTDANGHLTVNYPAMAAVLLEALKEQHAHQVMLDQLQEDQQQRINLLQLKMERLLSTQEENPIIPATISFSTKK